MNLVDSNSVVKIRGDSDVYSYTVKKQSKFPQYKIKCRGKRDTT